MTSRERSLSVFGTFDVENYGDLLFPLLVRHELCRETDALNLFSPLGTPVPWADALAPRPVAEAAATPADLCIVGGGNIISAEPTTLPAYAPLGGSRMLAYPSLWLGAALVAAANGSRLVWNAPGLPRKIRQGWARELCAVTLSACDHVAVRDEQSRAWLETSRPVAVVPDVALGLSRLWPGEVLAAAARNAFRSRGVDLPPRWLVFHFNDRYLDGGIEEAAAAAGTIAAAAAAFPVLIAVGPCHGDDALARKIAARMPECLLVDRPAGLKEIAGLIAHSVGYAGSSLHGLISALSYRRPAMAIARTSMPKFQGFLEHLGMTHRLLQSWASAATKASALLEPLATEEMSGIGRGLEAIDRHWATLRACLDEPGAAAQGRTELLAAVPRETPGRWAGQALWAMVEGRPMPCPICGGSSYGPGPGGRMSLSGRPPRCTACLAMERHRIFRLFFDELRAIDFSRLSCLMFSRDPTVSAAWFASFEVSVFGGENSLDIQRIDRPDAEYDVVICNHVLEHVPDYRAAIRELARITHPRGFLFLSFPNPVLKQETVDWGYPRDDQHGHFRVFGRDIEEVFRREIPSCQVIAVTGFDPVTGSPELAYVVTRSEACADLLRASGLSTRLSQTGQMLEAPSRTINRQVDEVERLAEQLRDGPHPEIGPRLQALAEQRPREPRPRLLLGEWFQRSGDLGKAAECFEGAMRDFPGNPWPAVRMLGLHLQRTALPQARDLYVERLQDSSLPENVRTALLRDLRVAIKKAGAEESLLPGIGGPADPSTDFEAHEYAGTCAVCGWEGSFARERRSARETYACGNCRATLRYRVQAEAILAFYGDLKATTLRKLASHPAFTGLRIFEPGVTGPFRRFLKGLPGYSMSLYQGDLESGELRGGVGSEDLMNLSMPTESVDLVISSDIFEHVRHPDRGFAEIARVLRPGGAHIFTVPTSVPPRAKTVCRVDVSGPQDVPILPAVYHGDGRGGRSLVYNDFGMDILDMLRRAGLAPSVHRSVREPIADAAIAFVAVK